MHVSAPRSPKCLMLAKSSRKIRSRSTMRSRKARSLTSPGHPKHARRSSVHWIAFKHHPIPRARQCRVNPKPPMRTETDRLGSRPADRQGQQPEMARLRQWDHEGRQMKAGKTRSLRVVVTEAPIPPRHVSVAGENESPRLPRGRRRRNRAKRSPIARSPVQQRREFLYQGTRGRDRQLKPRLLERRQRQARRLPHRECPAVPRHPQRRASLPALTRMTRTTRTLRQPT